MENIRETMEQIAVDGYPGAATFWVTVQEDDPATRMKSGDRVICARTKARPGMVTIVEGDGKIGFRSCAPGDGKVQNVVVAVVREVSR